MDDGFLKRVFDEGSGKYDIDLKTTNYNEVMSKCSNPKTRKKLEAAYNSRCTESNSDLIEELMTNRSRFANILGFSSYAEYVQDILMMKEPGSVKAFLDDLKTLLSPRWKNILSQMKQLKKKDCEANEYPELCETDEIKMWEYEYYLHLLTGKLCTLDPNIHEYFPIKTVLTGMFEIYEKLLGLEFIAQPHAYVWDDSVGVYQVKDKSQGILGYFYLDLFIKDGKMVGASTECMEQGCLDGSGKRLKSAVVVTLNLSLPTTKMPSLLSHNSMLSLFHEFGHAMHIICSRAQTSVFHGFQVEQDFVEAPSQMLENWCYEKESLKLMSMHYETGKRLEDEMVNNLVKSRELGRFFNVMLTLTLATIDQRIHEVKNWESSTKKASEYYNEIFREIMGIEVTPDTNPLAIFPHIYAGYDASYYGYLITQVYAQDMFDSKFKGNLLNEKIGMQYRELILQPGGSLDGNEMLTSFLGRKFTLKPFLDSCA